MLAMLSCALRYPSGINNALRPASEPPSKLGSHQYLDNPWSHPLAVAERYFPSIEIASSILRPPATQPAFTLDMQKPTSDPHSTSSSIGASTSDDLTPFSTGLTPPSSFKPSRTSHERSSSQIILSTSPEQIKHVNRSGSNLATAFAASIARPFSFSTPDSSSPPSAHPKKRLSPATSYLGAAAANLAWGPSAASSKATSNTQGVKSRFPPSLPDERRSNVGEKAHSFTTRLKNQDQFHNDGYASETLLDQSKEEQYAAYRSMYASMLLAWELPIASCKILQHNNSHSSQPVAQSSREETVATSLITIGRDTLEKTWHESADASLDLRKSCNNCGAILPPGPSSKRCPDCSARQASIICQLCHCVIAGLSSPCLNCGHVLHLSCRSALQEDEDSFPDGECVTGCGCRCADHLHVNVQAPASIDESTLLIPATDISTNEQEELGWHDVTEEAEAAESGTWRDVAYESLTRNLGGRFLTPKPSQIWRGGETRKESLSGFAAPRRSDSG